MIEQTLSNCCRFNCQAYRESGVSMTGGGYSGGIYGGDATDDYSGVVNNDLKPTYVGGGGLPRPSSYVDLRSG